jgi:hypothetical protein
MARLMTNAARPQGSDTPEDRTHGRAAGGRPASQAARVARMERVARLFDSSLRVPVVNRRIGLDGLIGLVPGVGDAVGAAVSLWLVLEAARGGARKRVLARMAGNALIDSTVGAVPLVGDLFDFAFKANLRNARLAADELRRRDDAETSTQTPRRGAERKRAPLR